MTSTTPQSASGREAPEIVALLIGAALLRIGAAGGGFAVLKDLVDLYGEHPAGLVVGAVGSAQALSELAAALVLARLADRFGRSRFLIGGPLVGFCALVLLAAAGSPSQLFGARLVEGLGAAAFIPTALGTIAAVTADNPRLRARASGAFEGSTLVGYVCGFLTGGFLYHSLHRGAFLVLACFYLAAAGVCWRYVPRIAPLPVSPIRVVVNAIVRRGPVRIFIPAWLAVNALVGAWIANLPPLLERVADPNQTLVHHIDERIVSMILAGFAFLLIVGIAVWTPYIHRRGPAATMQRAVPGLFVLIGTLALMNHLPLWCAFIGLPVAAGAVVWQAGFAPAAVTYLADCSESLAADRSSLMAFYTVTLAGGGALGALLGGAFSAWLLLDGVLVFGTILGVIAVTSIAHVARWEWDSPSPAD